MDDLDIMGIQLDFLLQRHETYQQKCNQLFNQVHQMLDEKLTTMHGEVDQESQEKIREIHSLVTEAQEIYAQLAEDDVEYLEAQKELVDKAQVEKDPVRRKALAADLLDGDELIETEELKRLVQEDEDSSIEEFETVVDDLQGALAEGSYEAMHLYMEEFIASLKGEDSHDDEDDFDDEEGEFVDENENHSSCGEDSCDDANLTDFLSHLGDMVSKTKGGCCKDELACDAEADCSGACGCSE